MLPTCNWEKKKKKLFEEERDDAPQPFMHKAAKDPELDS